MDNRYPPFSQGGTAQPGTGFPSLGGMQGLQNLQGGAQFPTLQSQMQGRPGGLGAIPPQQAANLAAAQQQQRMGGITLQPQPGAARMGVPGQQQFPSVNGMQNMRMGAAPGVNPSASGSAAPSQFQGLPQQQQQQPGGGLPGRPGMPGMPVTGGLGGFGQQQPRSLQPGGGGLGGARPGLGAGGAFSNATGNPSGDLLSMLNNRKEEVPSFNAADFPSLSAAGQQGRPTSQEGAESFAALLHGQAPKPAANAPFGDEDFPALPGSVGGGVGQQQLNPEQIEQLRRQQQQFAQQQAAAGMKPGAKPSGADRFGLLGLLSVIRMTDPDVTTLALGTDLTTLGLNLNSPEPLWKTFSSPWADGPGKPEPDFRTPSCYLIPPPRLTQTYFSRFQPDTLFYIFYGMPGDEAQIYAADELANRGWYYHKELKTWLTRAPNTEPLQKTDRFERGSFFLFDPTTWDVVRKDNFTVTFDALERPPGLLKAGGGAGGGGAAGQAPPPGIVPK